MPSCLYVYVHNWVTHYTALEWVTHKPLFFFGKYSKLGVGVKTVTVKAWMNEYLHTHTRTNACVCAAADFNAVVFVLVAQVTTNICWLFLHKCVNTVNFKQVAKWHVLVTWQFNYDLWIYIHIHICIYNFRACSKGREIKIDCLGIA